MLLIELQINGQTVRVSNEPLALEHYWLPVVASCGSIKIATDRPYGGYARPQYGKIEFTPELFEEVDHWPPPVSIPITIKITDSNETEATTIVSGTAHRTKIAEVGITYDVKADHFAGRFVDHLYNNTISVLFSGDIPIADASLSADTSLADSAGAPHINFTDKGDQVVIDSLSKVAACAGHLFYIDGSVAHLVDMLTDNGSRIITEFDYFPSSYMDPVPYATFRSGDTDLAGSYAYGRDQQISPVFSTDAAEVNKGLQRIKQILESPGAVLKMPITANPPKFGERITWTSEAMAHELTSWIRVRSLTYDFDNDQIVVAGEGGLS